MLFVPDGGPSSSSSYLLWNSDGSSGSSSGDILDDELQLGRDAELFASATVQTIDAGDEVRVRTMCLSYFCVIVDIYDEEKAV